MDVKASSVLKSKKDILCSEFLEAWRYNVILMSHSFCVALFTFSLLSHSDVHVKNVLKFVKMIRSEQNWNYDWFELATLEKYETFENFNTAPPLKMKAICWVIEKKKHRCCICIFIFITHWSLNVQDILCTVNQINDCS